MVEHQPSKLDTWVRFPSPAFLLRKNRQEKKQFYAHYHRLELLCFDLDHSTFKKQFYALG